MPRISKQIGAGQAMISRGVGAVKLSQKGYIIGSIETIIRGILRKIAQKLWIIVRRNLKRQVKKQIGYRRQVSVRRQVIAGKQRKALIQVIDRQVEVGKESKIINYIFTRIHQVINKQGYKNNNLERIVQGLIQGVIQGLIIILIYKGYSQVAIIIKKMQGQDFGLSNMMKRAKQLRKRNIEHKTEYNNSDLRKKSQFDWSRWKGMYEYHFGKNKMTKEEKDSRDRYWKEGSVDTALTTALQKDTRYYSTQYTTKSGKHVFSKFIGQDVGGVGAVTHFERMGLQEENLKIVEYTLTNGIVDDAGTCYAHRNQWVNEHSNVEKHFREHVFQLKNPETGQYFKITLPPHDAQNIFLSYLEYTHPREGELIGGNKKMPRFPWEEIYNEEVPHIDLAYLKKRARLFTENPVLYKTRVDFSLNSVTLGQNKPAFLIVRRAPIMRF